MTPIYDNRELVGYANSEISARRLLAKKLNVTTGFEIRVWRRSVFTCELLGVPLGFTYDIVKFF